MRRGNVDPQREFDTQVMCTLVCALCAVFTLTAWAVGLYHPQGANGTIAMTLVGVNTALTITNLVSLHARVRRGDLDI